ncbi:hypothetical protein J6590_047318 [Homalodisca vitripennis]|nr:hypothetical protein J6590_047318 [Homalodisca vitripennis]
MERSGIGLVRRAGGGNTKFRNNEGDEGSPGVDSKSHVSGVPVRVLLSGRKCFRRNNGSTSVLRFPSPARSGILEQLRSARCNMGFDTTGYHIVPDQGPKWLASEPVYNLRHGRPSLHQPSPIPSRGTSVGLSHLSTLCTGTVEQDT